MVRSSNADKDEDQDQDDGDDGDDADGNSKIRKISEVFCHDNEGDDGYTMRRQAT